MSGFLFFASLQSPYCYFALDRLEALRRRGWRVELRPVAPGILRLPDLFRDRPEIEQRYFATDVSRTAAFLGLPYAEADPYPVAMRPGTLYQAAEAQPRIDRLHGLLHLAVRAGCGFEVYAALMRLIWSGKTGGWDGSGALDALAARFALDLPPARRDPATEALLAENHAALLAAGHWGVPCFVFEDEAFYGQDRIDQLVWRLDSGGRGTA
ncbi:MAG: 2-hydroxychromene-2-carboxylate isomerase [Rhodospirillales bacterium]